MLQIEQDLLDETLKESPNIVTIRSLLYRGARANLTLEDGRPLIFAAVSLRHADVLSVLITGGARPDARHNFSRNPDYPRFYYIPERIIKNTARSFSASGGVESHTNGETAQLMIHFAEAVKIAAATSTVSFPWGAAPRSVISGRRIIPWTESLSWRMSCRLSAAICWTRGRPATTI